MADRLSLILQLKWTDNKKWEKSVKEIDLHSKQMNNLPWDSTQNTGRAAKHRVPVFTGDVGTGPR